MRNVSQYFELIEKAIEYSSAEDAEIEIERRDAVRGTIEGVVYLTDGARLEFAERITLKDGRPVKLKYRYQFVYRGVTVFRYDNAQHHPHITTHPHHKHVGATILPAFEPEFRQVLDEAVALLSEATSNSGHKGKKRRQRRPGKS